MFSEHAESATDIEREIALIWQQVLGIEALPGPSDDFFSLGGDSVAMIMAELRINQELSVNLPEGVMLGVSSLREFSQLIEERRRLDGVSRE